MAKSEEPGMGHNSAGTTFARDQLKTLIERIERLEEEKKATSDDIKDVYAEAKGNGFDTKAIKHIIKLRAMDPDERQELAALIETYAHALGLDAGGVFL